VEPGGQLDMQQLLAAAAAMQSQLMNAQQELADAEVQGTAGGGLVRATVNGQGELVDLSIDAAAIDASEPEETAQTISDLVLAAYRDACRAVDDLQQQTMAPFTAGFGGGGLGGLPGMPDLSGFPGLGAGPASQAGGTQPPGVPDQPDPDEPSTEDRPPSGES
jgi:nucleoid-associated protein EbfC